MYRLVKRINTSYSRRPLISGGGDAPSNVLITGAGSILGLDADEYYIQKCAPGVPQVRSASRRENKLRMHCAGQGGKKNGTSRRIRRAT